MGNAGGSGSNCNCPGGRKRDSCETDTDVVVNMKPDGSDVVVANGSSAIKKAGDESTEDPSTNIFWTKGKFDYDKATEDVYGVKHFTGVNKDIRPLLDYTYHKKYDENRVLLQDRIIEELSSKGQQQHDLLLPWVIFTAGAMGAGKGYVLEFMDKEGCLPLSQFVIVDPDQVRQTLPEWQGYVDKDPQTAAIKTQKEAGHIAEILGYKALRERWNVIFDGSLRDVEWYKVYFQKLRQSFPGIRLMILHIKAEREAVLKRAEDRGKATGRMVPMELLESSMRQVPQSVHTLAPFVDVAIRVNNVTGKDPQLEHEPAAQHPSSDSPLTWDFIGGLWRPIDRDGDGELSREEIQVALAQGTLTQDVVDTVDKNKDGHISKDELKKAQEEARRAGTLSYAE